MTITRRFRRSVKQELQERRRFGIWDFAGIGVLAIIFAEASVWPAAPEWMRMVVWGAIVSLSYLLLKLGTAQIRANAQPYDHTLTITDEGVEVADNLRKRSNQHPWKDMERVSITLKAFEIRHRSGGGETYLISREKLSKEEERFLGDLLVEL